MSGKVEQLKNNNDDSDEGDDNDDVEDVYTYMEGLYTASGVEKWRWWMR